jgi:UDP-3-O-[3-hydroxymyristoyl] N-acetylglucosamine deacetylase/3-hydroxyacyl-[acyl-carrier-protein] dehydratase
MTLAYHLDYGRGSPIAAQSYCIGLSPESFRTEIANSRTFLLESEADALRAAGIGMRTSASDLLIFGRDGVIGNELRYHDECARHKVLDLIGDLGLMGFDLDGLVVAHRSGHQTNQALARRLVELADRSDENRARNCPLGENGELDIHGIMKLLPHRYPFLLVDRVLELVPGRRVVAIKNVSINEPFFAGHWPGLPIMPGVLIVESLAQAAGILIAATVERRHEKVALIASLDGVKLRRPIVAGDQLRLEVFAQRFKPNAARITGVAKVGNTTAAEATLRFVILEADRSAGLAGQAMALAHDAG